jgi:hypothetical protein
MTVLRTHSFGVSQDAWVGLILARGCSVTAIGPGWHIGQHDLDQCRKAHRGGLDAFWYSWQEEWLCTL